MLGPFQWWSLPCWMAFNNWHTSFLQGSFCRFWSHRHLKIEWEEAYITRKCCEFPIVWTEIACYHWERTSNSQGICSFPSIIVWDWIAEDARLSQLSKSPLTRVGKVLGISPVCLSIAKLPFQWYPNLSKVNVASIIFVLVVLFMHHSLWVIVWADAHTIMIHSCLNTWIYFVTLSTIFL